VRKPLPGQLDLGFFPEQTVPVVATPPPRASARVKREARPAPSAPVATVTPTATIGPLDFVPHESATREERIMLALRRDLATLTGPPEYVCDRQFYEDRVAGYRAMLSA
jgi:hypothetical protein